MKNNVGGIDKILRIVAGLGLIAWAAVGNGPAWAWIGVMPLAPACSAPARPTRCWASTAPAEEGQAAAALTPGPASPSGERRVFTVFHDKKLAVSATFV